jgi:MutS2 family protein
LNKNAFELLEYNKIIEILKGYALSEYAKEEIDKLVPYVDINKIRINMKETTEARKIIDINSSIPIHSLKGAKGVIEKLNKGMVIMPEELGVLHGLLGDVIKLKRFMMDKDYVAPSVSTYALSMHEMEEVFQEIERCIVHGRVDDKASSELSKVRKKIRIVEERIKNKIDNYLTNDKYKGYLQEAIVTQRNGRYVIPVKSQYKKEFNGSVHDMSKSGSTFFIEPAEIRKAQDELNIYKIEEDKEVYKILANITNLIVSYQRELSVNIEIMIKYDFLFAKAKFSRDINGNDAIFNKKNYINIKEGRHPLIGKDAVPLDFIIGEEYKGLIITGPNTGGKTVALKTVGLMTMMAQAGMHVPVADNSEFAVFGDVLVDIGDAQSIQQSLSTFSSHIKNIINIIQCADEHSLVIIDEVGAGTDPGEGMGLAIAIIEEIYSNGSILLATTHYSEIKNFAREREGFINGSMDFDISTLKPLYKLNIGKAGESNAFLIALRLGMDNKLIERAHYMTYKKEKDYSGFILEKESSNKSTAREEHKAQIQKIQTAEKIEAISKAQKKKSKFQIGDCVYISFMNRTGIVYELENSKGEYGVLVMKKKIKVNKKRLSLYIDNQELYPEDYDYDVVLKSKDNRKKEKIMGKRHEDGIVVNVNEDHV